MEWNLFCAWTTEEILFTSFNLTFYYNKVTLIFVLFVCLFIHWCYSGIDVYSVGRDFFPTLFSQCYLSNNSLAPHWLEILLYYKFNDIILFW